MVIPDLRGHGASFRADLMGLSDPAKDIEELAQSVGLTDMVLIGHSMGALVVMTQPTGSMKSKGLILISGGL